jgi:nitroreductase
MIDEIEGMVTRVELEAFDDDYWMAQLRKCAHIVDKGIQREDFEVGHSRNFYDLGREALANIKSPEARQDPSVLWAEAILDTYNQAQESGAAVRPQELTPSRLSYSDLTAFLESRWSARRFLEAPVTEEVILQVAGSIRWASQSCNRQLGRVFACHDQNLVKQCMRTCAGATGMSDYVPSFLCFCVDTRAYSMPREYEVSRIDTALGIQNACLAAHSLGLSITLMSWAAHTSEDDIELRRLLDIPEHFTIVVNGVMGYPDISVAPPARKSVDRTCVIRTTRA